MTRQYINQEVQIKPHSRIFITRYAGVALPQAILSILYQDATLFLEREYRLMEVVMKSPVQRREK